MCLKLRAMNKMIIIFLSSFVTLSIYSYFRSASFGRKFVRNNTTKYILQWTKSNTEPFTYMGKEQDTFIKRHCLAYNCYVTSERTLLDDITDYDTILFHGPELNREIINLPTKRSPLQKYVFVSMESSGYYPIIEKKYDSYFNWTWTYKLNSNEYYGYIIIKNKQGNIIGPKEVMHWLKVDEMKPLDHELRDKLNNKTLAAAWFVSNCKAPSGRDKVAKQLQEKLAKHNMTLDIYGKCGTKQCPSNNMAECLRKVKSDYYFYLSFENSFSEDYVTEKLMHALQHYSVPIVYGGANYTRFMPDGSYLNARTLNIDKLVQRMIDLINNKEKYYDFFRWHNHYSYHNVEETPETDYYCRFCRRINDASLVKQYSSYDHFRKWWNT